MTEDQKAKLFADAEVELRKARHRFSIVFRKLIPLMDDTLLYGRSHLTMLARNHGLVERCHVTSFMVVLAHIVHSSRFREADAFIEWNGDMIWAWWGMRWKEALWNASMEAKPPEIMVKAVLYLGWTDDQ